MVPHPPAVLFPENLYHMCTCDGGSEGAVNRCMWGLAEGIVYDNPQNLERNMNKWGGGNCTLQVTTFLDRFLILASLNQVTTSLWVHCNSRMVLSGCVDSIDFQNM